MQEHISCIKKNASDYAIIHFNKLRNTRNSKPLGKCLAKAIGFLTPDQHNES